jgi:hypothetical protein
VSGDVGARRLLIERPEDPFRLRVTPTPRATGWQPMSQPDRDAESAYANLTRELTGLPLVGITLAGGDGAWSARHWMTVSAPTSRTRHVRTSG